MNPRILHHKAVMVACTSISESEVSISITILCLLCSPRYTVKTLPSKIMLYYTYLVAQLYFVQKKPALLPVQQLRL